MIVLDDAFDELLDRVAILEREAPHFDDPDPDPDLDDDPLDVPRREFTTAVDDAVKKVLDRRDGRAWYTQTLRRFGCRLHFLRKESRVYLVACAPTDSEDDAGDYST